ncbi:hypothetical protein DPMN_100860 [Dreissena polymorpha]|uniref:Uncharacterized protein n=4 Tax=Dreissena polymorpha TaxID=45954 RepID=A0A9D4R9J0_DREPO|nr:hypothetical protein DPMN_100860 [Dreissena polymorpha]
MESDNENDLPQAIEQPSMDSTAELSTETVSQHLQPPDRLSENDFPPAIDQPSMDSTAELSTETVSHHLQPPERTSAQRDSDMESGNKNDLPPAIKKPSMDSRAELSTETVSHHLQPLDRPSAQKDSDMESDNGNEVVDDSECDVGSEIWPFPFLRSRNIQIHEPDEKDELEDCDDNVLDPDYHPEEDSQESDSDCGNPRDNFGKTGKKKQVHRPWCHQEHAALLDAFSSYLVPNCRHLPGENGR